MKTLITFLVVLLLTSCTSEYSPSEQMLAFKKDMTAEQAVAQLQKIIWSNELVPAVCGSRGFWFDKDSNMKVSADGITMLAFKQGREIEKKPQGFDELIVYEKETYDYEFMFDKVNSIVLYHDPTLLPLFPECNQQLKDKYWVVDLYVDKLNSMKFIVMNNELDKTMAALTLVMPDKPVKQK